LQDQTIDPTSQEWGTKYCAPLGKENYARYAANDRFLLGWFLLDPLPAAAEFPAGVTHLALSMVALGDPVAGASCVGVGKAAMPGARRN
jgi:hypothetical protein